MTVLLASMTLNPKVVAHLRDAGGGHLRVADDEPALVEGLADADALIASDNVYSPAVAAAVRSARKLRWIQLTTAGYDNVKRHGVPGHIPVCNMGEAYSPSIAVQAIALMLGLQRDIPSMVRNQPAGRWEREITNRIVMPAGHNLVVLGLGSIGRETARLGRALGMHVIGISRSGRADPNADECHPVSALAALLPRADVLILSLPLDAATTRIVGAKQLALMKPTALVINVSRGGTLDTAALTRALETGRLGGAGLDVTDPEPLPADHPLWRLPNVIVSPHCAGATSPFGIAQMCEVTAANMARFLAGAKPTNLVTLS